MANHKSSTKRAKQTIRKTLVNTRIKSTVKTFEKKALTALTEGKLEDAKKILNVFTSSIDKAVKKGIYHKNKASRKISKLALKIVKAS